MAWVRVARISTFLLVASLLVACSEQSHRQTRLEVDSDGLTFRKASLSLALDQSGTPSLELDGITILAAPGEGLKPISHITIDRSEVTLFRLDPDSVALSRSDTLHGPGDQLRVLFNATTPAGVPILQDLSFDFPDRYPKLVVLHSTYRNLSPSDSITVNRVTTGWLALDSSRAIPEEASYSFHTFQGGSYEWGRSYAGIPLTPGFSQKNFMGLYTRAGFDQEEDEGGGINLVDVWNRKMGLALCHLAPRDLFVSFPTVVDSAGRVLISMVEEPDSRLGDQTIIPPGGTLNASAPVGLIIHHGDYFEPLTIYRDLLRDQGIESQVESPEWAFGSYWKTWGWKRDFTLGMVYDRVPQLLQLGIRQLQIDDGWQDFVGDWNPNRSKYPNGEADIVASLKHIKELGIERVYLWWNPLGVDPDSAMARKTEWLVLDENGKPASVRQHSLCPAHPPVQEHLRGLVRKWISEWGYDGLYNDFAMNSVAPACFNPAHRHARPTDSFEATPQIWQVIWEEAHQVHSSPFLESCICSLPHSLFKNPYTNMTSASDPLTNRQVRARIKVEKATHGPRWAYENCYIEEGRRDPLPQLSDADFASSVGIGAVLTTEYPSLTESEFAQYQKWYSIYFREMVSSGEYLNLYDIAYDLPETHAIRKGETLYFAFYADAGWEGPLELRGLGPREYRVLDYVENRDLGSVSGPQATIPGKFDHFLLVKCIPQ